MGVEGRGGKKIFIKTVELVRHEIAPSFPSHRGKMLLTTPDDKKKKRGIRRGSVLVLFQISAD